MITSDQFKHIETRVADLKHYLDIDSKKIEVEEEELCFFGQALRVCGFFY